MIVYYLRPSSKKSQLTKELISPKTTYSGGVTQVLLSTYKRTDIGVGDAYRFDTQKGMRHKWQLMRKVRESFINKNLTRKILGRKL